MAVRDWLRDRGLVPTPGHWYVEAALDTVDEPAQQLWSALTDTRFHINLYPGEWGYFFCHGSRASWIRVTDRPLVHNRDDYSMRAQTPALRDIGPFVASLEQRYNVRFQRELALVRSNIDGAEAAVRAWLAAL